MKKIKTITDFQKVMQEIAERENLFVTNILAVECRLLVKDHVGSKDFYCVAEEFNSDKFRAYYFYSQSSMFEPDYIPAESKVDAKQKILEKAEIFF